MAQTLDARRPEAGRSTRLAPYPGAMADGWHWAGAGHRRRAAVHPGAALVRHAARTAGLDDRQATRRALPALIVVPIGFALALLLPIWVAGVLILVPLIVIA